MKFHVTFLLGVAYEINFEFCSSLTNIGALPTNLYLYDICIA